LKNSLSSGLDPVIGVGHSKGGRVDNVRSNQHGLVAGQDGLTEGDTLSGLVLAADGANPIIAVWLVGERLLDLAVFVAVEAAILSNDQHE
jgi:hypothetical protein